MEIKNGRWIWNNAVSQIVGGNSDGPFEQATSLGIVALSHGIPLTATYTNDKEKVSAFLRAWADSVDRQD